MAKDEGKPPANPCAIKGCSGTAEYLVRLSPVDVVSLCAGHAKMMAPGEPLSIHHRVQP